MSRIHVSTRRRLRLEPLEDRLCLSAPPVGATLAQPDTATQARLSAAYGQLPLSFEANRGQVDSRVNFLSRGAGYSLFLTPTKAVLSLTQGGTSNVVSMRVVGANLESHVVGLDKQAGVSNYFIGNDPSKWHTNVPNYAEASYQGVYRGIDLVYHGSQQQLEYDFVVAPGTNLHAIRLAFDGVRSASLNRAGNLVLHTSGGDVVEHAPVVYQEINGRHQAVAGRYVLEGNRQVGFQVGRYDHSKPLVIDPVLSYSTYLGGSGQDEGYGIAVDGAGNAYVTGSTTSNRFPTKNPLQNKNGGGQDAFITKMSTDGTALVYSTYLGGSGDDVGLGIAVDSTGNAYVTGRTGSTNFPTKNAYQTTYGGGEDVFITELNAAGSALVYSTYLGGNSTNMGWGIAVDGADNAYITGSTGSTDFPTTPGAFQATYGGNNDGFVAKLNPALSGAQSLVYSTYLGGAGVDEAFGIAVDGAGNAYVTGWTTSANFPTTIGAFQTTSPMAGKYTAFVTKINPTGSALIYSTYLGGSRDDRGNGGIAVDSAGEAYVTGYTASTDFPTTPGAFQTVYGGTGDAFVTKLKADGSGLVYSTYLGGSDEENGVGLYARYGGIALDAAGNAYVTGLTFSTNFPTKNAFQATNGGGGWQDAFITKLNTDGSAQVYSTYVGGSSTDIGYAIAVDGSGNAYVTGQTYSDNFPVFNAFQPKRNGNSVDAFVTKISAN
jgi:hypothetical protein